MLPLLVTLFIIKIYARTNIFNFTKTKHGQDILRAARSLERMNKRRVKLQLDIKFINRCKQDSSNANICSRQNSNTNEKQQV